MDPPEAGGYADPLITRLQETGIWHERQFAGNNWAMGCVALEITQRCNLDCSLCYLSPHSEAVMDIPLAEIFRRIETIFRHYGPHTDVQVTGGDPTLRKREDLIAIVRRIRDRGMRPSLFTNGIRATRNLLQELAANGLFDVAFHVDMTQGRRGYATEAALNELRAKYIERARGLGLGVVFNTTVYDGNFGEIPGIVRFFRNHADVVGIASFQLQADTGRGELRQRAAFISPQSVARQISDGAGTRINFDATMVGHPKCNKYAICLEANGNLYNVYDATPFLERMLRATHGDTFDRGRGGVIRSLFKALMTHPGNWGGAISYLLRLFWVMKTDLMKAGGRVNKLSFFIHNFMDASHLEADRCRACVFMVASADGMISMCVHNAKRDEFILKPIRHPSELHENWWNPLTGITSDAAACGKHPNVSPAGETSERHGRSWA